MAETAAACETPVEEEARRMAELRAEMKRLLNSSGHPVRVGPGVTGLVATADCGEDKLDPSPVEYPCVRRFRHRRIMTLLWLQGFKQTFDAMLNESDVYLCVGRLKLMVKEGKWSDAISYVSRFLPPGSTADADGRGGLSVEAQVLLRFLETLSSFSQIIAGKSSGCAYLEHGKNIPHATLRLRSIEFNLISLHKQHRSSLDWERVKRRAAKIVARLTFRSPELKDSAVMPAGPMAPHDVVPIGFGLRPRRRPMKQPRYSLDSMLHFYHSTRDGLPSPNHSDQESPDGLHTKAMDWLADIIDESLQAGKRRKVHQGNPLQTSRIGATIAPTSQTMLGSMTGYAKNPGMPSLGHTGMPSAPGYHPRMSLLGHTGMPSARGYHPGMPSVTNAGATVVPTSHSMTGYTKIPGMPSLGHTWMPSAPGYRPGMPSVTNAVTNADILSRHVVSPSAPFSGTMVTAPVPSAVFASMANPARAPLPGTMLGAPVPNAVFAGTTNRVPPTK